MKYDIYQESFRQFIRNCPEEIIEKNERYVFLSDLHMGNGGSRDDLAFNRILIESMLEKWYLERNYYLILNGDIEDLSKFPLFAIRRAWPHLLEIFGKFAERGRLRKIVGNHDFELDGKKDYPWPIHQGLVYRFGQNRIFVFHGHQASDRYVKYDFVSDFLIRYFAKPLHIRNSSVSKNSRRRFATEKYIYRAARTFGVIAIAGHTHRPLFESLSKFDNIRITIEELLRDYVDADPEQKELLEEQIVMYRTEMEKLAAEKEKKKKTQSLYGAGPFLIPCLFNSGSATGKHGINALEIRDGNITLVYWTNGKDTRPYIESEASEIDSPDGELFRYTLQQDRLDAIFTRISLLGGVHDDGVQDSDDLLDDDV